MMIHNRYIGYWLCSILMLLCLACGGSDGDAGDVPGPTPERPEPTEPPKLSIQIYTPDRATVTRGDTGFAEPEDAEKYVHSLDIWVFEAGTETLVGHLSPDVSKSFEGGTYQIPVDESFADRHPKVDVFVVVNAYQANTGLNLSDRTNPTNPTRASLLAAKIQHQGTTDYFGVTTLTKEPSETYGLPMSGILLDQVLTVNLPVLKVDPPVKVMRAVSKVRFLFSRTDTGDSEIFKIKGITLANGVIPTAEYLFLDPTNDLKYHIDGGYESGVDLVPSGVGDEIPDIPISAYPAKYAYDNNNESQPQGQNYEDLIARGLQGVDNNGVPEIVQLGRFYFRESDRQMTGTISYQIEKSTGDVIRSGNASFSMVSEGDFSRNHTWIVYGYFAGKETLKVSSVDVTDWEILDDANRQVFNW